jgi:hypothetical protein
VNRDGKLDIIVATDRSVDGLLGNGDGTFQKAVSHSTGGQYPVSVSVADANGDGKPDIIVANKCATSSCALGNIGILFGNGDGTFKPVGTYYSGGYTTLSVVVGDVNGDGHPDIVVSNQCVSKTNCANSSVVVLLGNGHGGFPTRKTTLTSLLYTTGSSR